VDAVSKGAWQQCSEVGAVCNNRGWQRCNRQAPTSEAGGEQAVAVLVPFPLLLSVRLQQTVRAHTGQQRLAEARRGHLKDRVCTVVQMRRGLSVGWASGR